jgi:hypothetical protein
MTRLTLTDDLARVARRCVWFEPPERAIADPARFAAYVLTYGTHEDVKVLRAQVDDAALRALLDKAPPGIFDPRSWAYWNLKLGRFPAPPTPVRTFHGR